MLIYFSLIILLFSIFCAGFLWQDFHIGENEVVFVRSKLECKICSKKCKQNPGDEARSLSRHMPRQANPRLGSEVGATGTSGLIGVTT